MDVALQRIVSLSLETRDGRIVQTTHQSIAGSAR
jgi:hypothetical protein